MATEVDAQPWCSQRRIPGSGMHCGGLGRAKGGETAGEDACGELWRRIGIRISFTWNVILVAAGRKAQG